MTTIILHGGASKIHNPSNDKFFSLFSSLTTKRKISIAMVYWARPRETWDDVFNRDKPRILSQTDKTIYFTIPETPGQLMQQMSTIDVVYVAGGDAPNIEPLYKSLGGLKEALKGKIYLGSSMGAFMASTNYVLSSDEKDTTTVHPGLGLVPINVLCHWDVEPNQQMKEKLLTDYSTLAVVKLKETEFVKYEL